MKSYNNIIDFSGDTVVGLDSYLTITGGTIGAGMSGTSVDTINRLLFDSTSTGTSIDWQNRQLYYNDSLVTLDWYQCFLANGSGPTLNWLNKQMFSTIGLTIDWEAKILYSSGSPTPSIDWENRKMIASDGSDVFEWSGSSAIGNSSNINIKVAYDSGGGSQNSLTFSKPSYTAGIMAGYTGEADLSFWVDSTGTPVPALTLKSNQDAIFYGTIVDTGSVDSISSNERKLYNSSGNTIIDWENSTLYADSGFGNPAMFFSTRRLVSSYNTTVLDWELMKIYDRFGGISIDATDRRLYDGATNSISADYSLRILYDSTGTGTSINYSSRILYDSLDVISLEYSNRIMKGASNDLSLDYGNRILHDNGAEPTVDWQNRTLKYNSGAGSKISLDWHNHILYDNTGTGTSIDYQNRLLKNSSGDTTLNWDSKTLFNDWIIKGGSNDGSTRNTEWQDSDGVVLGYLRNDGYLKINGSVNVENESGSQFSSISTGGGITDYASYDLTNNVSDIGQLFLTSSGYTVLPFVGSNALGFYNNGIGGIALAADNATGNIRFATGGLTEKFRMSSDGNFSILSGNVVDVSAVDSINTNARTLHNNSGTTVMNYATNINMSLTNYADNTAAVSGGLVTGDLYRTGGAVMIVI